MVNREQCRTLERHCHLRLGVSDNRQSGGGEFTHSLFPHPDANLDELLQRVCIQLDGESRRLLRKEKPGSVLLSHLVSKAVPSALEGLTSVFGMGTGVSPPLSPPGKHQYVSKFSRVPANPTHLALLFAGHNKSLVSNRSPRTRQNRTRETLSEGWSHMSLRKTSLPKEQGHMDHVSRSSSGKLSLHGNAAHLLKSNCFSPTANTNHSIKPHGQLVPVG